MNKKTKRVVGLLIVGALALGAIFASSVNQPNGDTFAGRGGGSIGIL
ncbi:MAG: hypothetical protein E7H33_09580 [Clostridium perfringens]|nr:hypothetical protein [Clostridium perfringens]